MKPRGKGPRPGGGSRNDRGDRDDRGGRNDRSGGGGRTGPEGRNERRQGENQGGNASRPAYGKTFGKQGLKTGGSASFRKGRPAGPPPSKQELGRLLLTYGVKLPQPTLDSLWAYHQLLRAGNKDLDLTRLIGFETIAQRHYADCMILHGLMQGKWPSPLVDVGSGAGFPGIMIKLMSPKTRLVLAEPRPRRVAFLERVIKELKLKDITVFPHKVTSRSLTEPMAGTITRAFETVEKTLPRLGGCLRVGGRAIFMKGPKVAEELTDLKTDEYRVVKNHIYRIPNTTLDRALLVMERIRITAQPATMQDLGEDDEIGEPESGEEGKDAKGWEG